MLRKGRIPLLVAAFLIVAMVLVTGVLATLSVSLAVTSDRNSYSPGSSAHIEFFFVYGPNVVRGTVTIPSSSYEVIISGSSGPILAMRTFIDSSEPITIPPNTTQKLGEFDWNLKDTAGIFVPPGKYKITVSLLDYALSGEIMIEVSG